MDFQSTLRNGREAIWFSAFTAASIMRASGCDARGKRG
jgi:hypothetical protein